VLGLGEERGSWALAEVVNGFLDLAFISGLTIGLDHSVVNNLSDIAGSVRQFLGVDGVESQSSDFGKDLLLQAIGNGGRLREENPSVFTRCPAS